MQPHYITLHVVRRALYKSDQVGVFNRLCAISATAPGVNRSRWIPAEFHKQPGNHGKAVR